MTTLQVFAAGLAYVAQPGPYLGYGWRVQQELDARDRAAMILRTAPYGSRDWRAAAITRDGAEARLGRLLDVTPPAPEQLVIDDPWLTDLYDRLTANDTTPQRGATAVTSPSITRIGISNAMILGHTDLASANRMLDAYEREIREQVAQEIEAVANVGYGSAITAGLQMAIDTTRSSR